MMPKTIFYFFSQKLLTLQLFIMYNLESNWINFNPKWNPYFC